MAVRGARCVVDTKVEQLGEGVKTKWNTLFKMSRMKKKSIVDEYK
jgi:hypothetical protein